MLEKMKKYQQNMIEWRRALHQIPELGLDLPKTVAYVKGELDKMGVSYQTLVQGNAIVAMIEGKKGEGKTIALRADMDALPIPEETGLSFQSKNGCMHACGHDGHTAMLLGAVKYFVEHSEEFAGKIKFFFQPGEENPGGALPMIEEGAMENPKVDAVIGLHEGIISEEVAPGKIGYRKGNMMAAVDEFCIRVKGRGSHGAYPEMGVDPIVLSAELIVALHSIVSREVKSTEPAVISIGKIQGGYARNIIPSEVILEGTVRSFSPDLRVFLQKRICEVAKGITELGRGSCEIEYENLYPSLRNEEAFTDLFVEAATKVLGKEALYEMKDPVLGGEDMSYYLEKAPGTFFFLSNPKIQEDGSIYPHHHPKFDIDEEYFSVGASLMVQTALDFLNKK